MQELSPAQRRELRARAHHLDPVVSISGNGLSANVLKEIDQALKAHELIKIRVYGDDREIRATYLAEICKQLDCASVQSIGKLLVVFRINPELHLQPLPRTQPARTNKKKAGEAKAGFNLRPGRPTTTNAPRKALTGAPAPRYRKPAAGSGRARKSAR
ncbi:MAG: RNA-binding protein [Candidatus Dactylopiibacterium carminicum]|uniref:RNA-binding protein n=1 Tax=Candidatus Dactylopiibacterium carminicum TaxID=857335 RepID=A0A272EP08_9RHOO|nr:ribosome assembly RNA-binding protein YhbY [Candidatus Dactylopiibacterium carminicum]KAF7598202.1 ribosome assembly RNA-binding protein YhbY [Candidatus Dactylopiibacterium carminicum]PAS91854.1 MAG: RNA-binding protein [Candidatus Dactylopiibacterium carminicum]PAS94625.1 MAG: RNA-binding protein [Candidatus Dactylopiibacterium carminicum]PAS96920.1 MAG: RNA-binding protein [Candidatus Dactylopiibacterium carminicum]